MNHDIGDVGLPYIFRKLKNSYQSFCKAGSAITIDNDSIITGY